MRNRQFEASFFLRHVIPSDTLFSLRSLELAFTARFYNFFGTDDFSDLDRTIYDDWKRTLDYIAPYLKRLKLRLHLGVFESDSAYSGHIQQSQERLFQVYEHIVQPLRKLQSLELFLVRAASPFNLEDLLGQQPVLRALETHLESLVMGGKDGSMAAAKVEYSESEWWIHDGPYPYI